MLLFLISRIVSLSLSHENDNNSYIFREELTNESINFSGGTQTIPERIDVSSEPNVYITNSFFTKCSGLNGGAISYSNSTGKFFIEFSTFSECYSTNYGGAIYTSCGDCVIYCFYTQNLNNTLV